MKPHLELLAPAKINLFLELDSKRPDGFHELETVMACVNLYDRLSFAVRDDHEIHLSVGEGSLGELPPVNDNLVTKALRLLQQRYSVTQGMNVCLTKRIPSQAGLGGASSDTATALAAANKLWGICLPLDELAKIGAELGSDVPFFIYGGTARCTGRGEKVNSIESLMSYPVLIAKPPVGLSTPEVFQYCEIPSGKSSSEPLLIAILRRNNSAVRRGMLNRLQPAANKVTEWTQKLSYLFEGLGCVSHQLSGSGSCYFGLFHNWNLLRNAAGRLLQRSPNLALYSCQAIGPLAQNCPGFLGNRPCPRLSTEIHREDN